jgi:hypothetical protein
VSYEQRRKKGASGRIKERPMPRLPGRGNSMNLNAMRLSSISPC